MFKGGDFVYNTYYDKVLTVIDTNLKDGYKDYIICSDGKMVRAYELKDLVSLKEYRSIKISKLLV